MNESKHKGKAHSAEAFIESRDLWWNADFLDLCRKRWNLGKVRRVLDVGCGVGHWGRALAPLFRAGTRITGIDPEKKWIRKADKAARTADGRCRFEFRTGTAEATGFPDAAFDMVTCQTVLIHVPDVKAALIEMLRVLKPGGLLALAEPDNFSSIAAWNSLRDEMSVEEHLEGMRIIYLCERGKELLGEGDSSVGSKLPGTLASLGYGGIRCWISDRTIPLYAPYRLPEQKITVRERLRRNTPEEDAFFKQHMLRYFLAAGGAKPEFLDYWKRGRHWEKRYSALVREGRYSEPGTSVMHMVSVVKPEKAR